MSCHSFHLRRRHQGGITLILVLSFILLLTAVVLVFLSRSMIARQLSTGSLKQSSADQFALSALDVVTGNLKQEIANSANSSTSTYTGNLVYRPIANTNVLPIRFGNPPLNANGTDPTPNLVRISSRSDGGQNFPSSLASAVNSATDVSVNGRSITLPRWNSHYLLPVQNSGTANTDSTPVSAFTAPDWVLVTDSSPTGTFGPAVLTAPSTSVIGRYAYAIYDEGGLLDVNVAGYPSQSTIAQSGDKPGLAYADLTQLTLPVPPALTGTTSLLTTADVDNLVGWRNYASVQPTGAFGSLTIPSSQTQKFYNLITGNVTGFLTVNTATYNSCTDQAFLSRQQLIKYLASTGTDTTAHANNLYNALQYLGTFSRDLNAPTWSPATPTGSTINYAALSGTITSANRDILGVRVTGTFTRADGTIAQVGDPLIKYRFPLNRLQGLNGMQGNNNVMDSTDVSTMVNGVLVHATAATIQRDFGLVYNAGDLSSNPWSPGQPTDLQAAPHWNYCGPSGTTIQSSIATLGSIGNREPNFFELLKAAILSGSLGRDAGPNGEYLISPPGNEEGPASGIQTSDQNVDFQVIQLGANILNQVAADSFPREIHFADPNNGNAETAFYGIANLPYLQRVFSKTASTQDPVTNLQNGALGWYMAEIWNPHQNFGYTDTAHIPTNFRFCGDGYSAMMIPSYPQQQSDNPSWPAPPKVPNSTSQDLTQSGYVQFTVPYNSQFCRDPTLLSLDGGNTPSFASSSTYTPSTATLTIGPTPTVGGSNGPDSYYGNSVVGLYTGSITISSNEYAANQGAAGVQPQGCNLYLEYSPDGGSTWRIYSKIRNMMGEHAWNPWAVCFYFEHTDPRTDRFGTSLGQWTYSTSSPYAPAINPPGQSLRPTRGLGSVSYDYFPYMSSGFTYAAGSSTSSVLNNFYMGTLSDNANSVPALDPANPDPPNALPSNVYYADQDGIVRPATGAYAFDVQGDGRPLIPYSQTGNYNSRPIILNRPFRNVGELGYAFRDEPWKDIDFFTSTTGDAGLLDFFCINESTTTTPMVAGTVSLNTRQAPVLQAILAGEIKNEVTPSTGTITGLPTASSEAASIASSIVTWTQSTTAAKGPFQYRGDLLTKAAANLVSSSAATADQQIKTRREAAIRALSDEGTTRTWTLLVDLVAQVGHYPPGSTKLSQFVVDGEKRYWLHLAIDRYTGQVIDRVLEPVYE
jgi:Tfp pilus assembly protein PilX